MTTAADRNFSAIVRVNGSEDTDFYKCIDRIVVNEDLEQGSSFEINIVLCRNEDGSWPHLEDENLNTWNQVTIAASFPDDEQVIMDGYISNINVDSNEERGETRLNIRGVDASYIMNMQAVRKVWNGMTYEQIAEDIFQCYGFTPIVQEVEGRDSESGDQEELPAVNQNATDHQFLKELAHRKGYEFFVRGSEAHFHIAKLDETPQKLIAVNFGKQTNCSNVRIDMDGTLPTQVIYERVNRSEGIVDDPLEVDSSGLDPLGRDSLADLRGQEGLPQRTVRIQHAGAATQSQMMDFAQGVLRRNAWWVRATGTLNGLRYGRVLRSKQLVTIKGLGAVHNGLYYVRKVTHTLAPRSYSMQFEACRNGINMLGTEDFTGEDPDVIQFPLAVGPGAESGAATSDQPRTIHPCSRQQGNSG